MSWLGKHQCAVPRGYGATAARLTPDQKVGSSNLSVLIFALTTRKPAPLLPSSLLASAPTLWLLLPRGFAQLATRI